MAQKVANKRMKPDEKFMEPTKFIQLWKKKQFFLGPIYILPYICQR